MLLRFSKDEQNAEILKAVVFGLSQLPSDVGIPPLIEIARTHPSATVRKEAVFWLGQSDDESAREALLNIVRGQ